MRRLLVLVAVSLGAVLTPTAAGAQGWTCYGVPGSGNPGVWTCHYARDWNASGPGAAYVGLGGETGSDIVTMTAYRGDGAALWGMSDTVVDGVNAYHSILTDVATIKVSLTDFRPSPQSDVTCVQTMRRDLTGGGSFGVTGPPQCG